MLRSSDDLVVVDTSKERDGTQALVERFGGRFIWRPDMLIDGMDRVRRWLPEWEEKASGAPQIATGVLRSFAEARSCAQDYARNDVIFWIDSDDIIEEKVQGDLRRIIDEHWERKELSLVFLDYEYSHDSEGNPSALLKRERVYDRRIWYWKGVCHEVLVPNAGANTKNVAYFQDVESRIVHRKDHAGTGRLADIRNYLILREQIEQEEGKTSYADTRYYFYLANSARGLGRFQEAVDFYKLTIGRSGSKDDCFLAAQNCATIYMTEGFMFPASAYQWAFEAIKINPDDPRGYFQAQHASYLLGRWDESLWWFQAGCEKHVPRNSLHLYEPYDCEIKPYMVAALAAKEREDEGTARACLEHLMRLKTAKGDVPIVIEEVRNWLAARRIGASLYAIGVNSGATNEAQQQRAVRRAADTLAVVPFVIEESGVGKLEPKDTRRGDDLVFYCGKAWEPWGPRSAQKGLGGSERATWEVARRMAKRGFRVTVYCSVPHDERGVDDAGVLWRHWAEFDKTRPRGTIVYWRSPGNLELPFPAMKRVVWCHDVQSPGDWTPARIALCDHCLVLSAFHKATLQGKLPPEKVIVTRNGIDADLWRKALAETEKNPKRIMFSSSPDRGVLSAIRAFQIARSHDPELELHLFYGFSRVFQGRAAQFWAFHVPDLGHEQSAFSYQYRVEQAVLETPGVHWHGRASWKRMAKEFALSGIWLYPTSFTEISCIGAMEAQAAGCALVTTDVAALAETVDWSSELAFRCEPAEPQLAAMRILQAAKIAADDPRRTELSIAALERFDWDGVCDEWAPVLRTEEALVT